MYAEIRGWGRKYQPRQERIELSLRPRLSYQSKAEPGCFWPFCWIDSTEIKRLLETNKINKDCKKTSIAMHRNIIIHFSHYLSCHWLRAYS